MYQEMQLNINAYERFKHVQKLMFSLSAIKHNLGKLNSNAKQRLKYSRGRTFPTSISVGNFSERDEEKILYLNSRSIHSSGSKSLRSQSKQADNSHSSFLQSGYNIISVTAKKEIKSFKDSKKDVNKTTNFKRKNIRIKRQKSIKKRLFSANPK